MSLHSAQDKQICEEIVTKIATLAKLRLTEEEATLYQSYFTELLTLFHELDSLSTMENVPLDTVLTNADDCREDIATPVDTNNIKAASPHFNEVTRYFDVPQFIEYNDE